MKKLCFISLLLFVLLPLAAAGQQAGHNYVMSRTMLSDDGSEFFDEVTYYDGYGYPYETVRKGAAGGGGNLAAVLRYDRSRRVAEEWLPMATAMDYVAPADFFSAARSATGDQYPYARYSYEDAPTGRITSQHTPGEDYADCPALVSYGTNTASGDYACTRYEAADGEVKACGNYPPGLLRTVTATDEDGRVSVSFTDHTGRKVLDRRVTREGNLDTYYVHDQCGRLAFVLQPMYSLEPDLERYAFAYEYDGLGRCISSRLPGADPVTYVYDSGTRPVFIQDGNRRKRGVWLFTFRDGAGRVVLTGECSSVPDGISDEPVRASRNGSGGINGSGYSVNIDIDDATVLTADYYDNYYFTGLQQFKSKSSLFRTRTEEATGLRTGGLTRILGSDSVLVQLVEYDSKGRPVREIATNHLSGYDETRTTYTFSGSPATVRHTHSSRYLPQPVTHTVAYTYDGVGRPATAMLTLPDGTMRQLAAYGYDGLGRIGSERLGGTVETAYGYTLQGWRQTSSNAVHSQRLAYGPDGYVTQKSDTYRRASVAESYSYDDAGRLVAFESEYKGPPGLLPDFGSTFDGAVWWPVLSENVELRVDGSYIYDANGNITHYSRLHSNKPEGASGYFVSDWQVEDLLMVYDGNRLRSADNHAEFPDSLYVRTQFQDRVQDEVEYAYDANGNMTRDANKGITKIKYNSLGLPEETVFGPSDHSIRNKYDARGRKLSTSHHTRTVLVNPHPGLFDSLAQALDSLRHIWPFDSIYTTTTRKRAVDLDPLYPWERDPVPMRTVYERHYCGGYVYEDGRLDRMELPPWGYVRHDSLFCYVRDYRGDVVAVVGHGGEPVETTGYDPYGAMTWADGDVQPRKHAGKEWDPTHGLELYDFGARHLDPVLGRFTTPDPAADQYPSISPYAYCAANPLRYEDPTGMFITANGDDEKEYIFDPEEGIFTDFLGNTSDNFFIEELTTALSEISSTNTGKELVNYLATSENEVKVTYMPGLRNYMEIGSIYNEIFWNPYLYTGGPSQFSDSPLERPPFIGLAHEMAHAERDAKGMGTGGLGFMYEQNLPFDEIYATHIENKIRAQSGVPLRTHYIYETDEDGTLIFPKWSQLLDWDRRSLYYGGYDYMQQREPFGIMPPWLIDLHY